MEISISQEINYSPASDLCCQITFARTLYQDQVSLNAGPDVDPNCLKSDCILKEIFGKVDFPACKKLNIVSDMNQFCIQ